MSIDLDIEADDCEFDTDDGCDHDEFEHDILTGRATCSMCDHVWYLTASDLEFLRSAEANYDAYLETIDAAEPIEARALVLEEDDLPF